MSGRVREALLEDLEALSEVLEWSGGPPTVREVSGDRPVCPGGPLGGPGGVGRPFHRSGRGQ